MKGGGEVNILSKFQLPSSYGLGGEGFFKDIFRKDELPNELICDKDVCRTSPATLGLIIMWPYMPFLSLTNTFAQY